MKDDWSARCTCTIFSGRRWYDAPLEDAMTTPDLLARARAVRMLSCDVDGVLTDGKLYYADDGSEMKAFSTLDGLGLKMLHEAGIVVAWITGSSAPAVTRRAKTLSVAHVVLGAENKLAPWERLRSELGMAVEECAHIGDDLPDLPLLLRCGLSTTVPHAPEVVKRRAHYVTRADGGAGAVREVCELILGARGDLAQRIAQFES
jgi:3-deoxy-D-manno-octulosonate 8-phosphate phosphatase (KDO 8-P phosphatase)